MALLTQIRSYRACKFVGGQTPDIKMISHIRFITGHIFALGLSCDLDL